MTQGPNGSTDVNKPARKERGRQPATPMRPVPEGEDGVGKSPKAKTEWDHQRLPQLYLNHHAMNARLERK